MKTAISTAALVLALLLTLSFAFADPRIDKLKLGKTTLSTSKLFELASSNEGIVLLDVRGPKNFAAGHIPGAINIPGWKINAHEALPEDRSRAVVCYCGNAKCAMSFYAADELLKLGYTNVFVYEQGVAGWKENGHALIPSSLEQWPTINTADLRLMVQSGGSLTLFDTRTANDFLNGSVYGAKNLPALAIDAENKLLPGDKSAFLVLFGSCPIDESPFVAAKALTNLGYTHVRIYSGGYAGWLNNQ